MGPEGRCDGGRPLMRLDRASKATPAHSALMATPSQRDVSSHRQRSGLKWDLLSDLIAVGHFRGHRARAGTGK